MRRHHQAENSADDDCRRRAVVPLGREPHEPAEMRQVQLAANFHPGRRASQQPTRSRYWEGEEMALGVRFKAIRVYVLCAALVDFAWGNVVSGDQVSDLHARHAGRFRYSKKWGLPWPGLRDQLSFPLYDDRRRGSVWLMFISPERASFVMLWLK